MAEEAAGEIARKTATLVAEGDENDADPFVDLEDDEEEVGTNEVVIEDETD